MVNPLNALKAVVKVTGLEKGFAVPISGIILAIIVGQYFDRQDVVRQSRFRDRSYLYGGTVKEGDPPSWPHPDCILH